MTKKENLIKRYFAHANDGDGREDKTLFGVFSFPLLILFFSFVGVLCLGGRGGGEAVCWSLRSDGLYASTLCMELKRVGGWRL